jgi:glycosyltransferase involved in cell wall biosynthesis
MIKTANERYKFKTVMNQMKISVITVTYNSEKTLLKCIESVNKQNYGNIEHILVDGGSLDSSVEMFKNSSLNKGTIISEPDKGIYDAMNKGVSVANGDIIGFLNSDDFFFSSNSLSIIAENFKPGIQCVYGNLLYVDKKLKIKRNWISNDFKPGIFSRSWSPAHPTFYCLNSVYKKHGYYRTDFKIAADVDLMLRFLEVCRVRSRFINDYLVVMLEGGVSSNSILSTLIITKEVKISHIKNGIYFNLLTYIYYKIKKGLNQIYFSKLKNQSEISF